MNKFIFICGIVFIVLLTGCSTQSVVEDLENYQYTLHKQSIEYGEIVFYKADNGIGNVLLEKDRFSWSIVSHLVIQNDDISIPHQYSYVKLSNDELISVFTGIVTDDEIKVIELFNEEVNIIEHEGHRFWYHIIEGEHFTDIELIGYSEDGEVLSDLYNTE